MNYLISIITIFLSYTLGQNLSGIDQNRRIRGGELTPHYPFFVFLSITNPKITINCGASLLTPNGAVTAAHCLIKVKSITAYFGSKKISDGLTRSAKSWMMHPQYDFKSDMYDVGVLVWKEPISWYKGVSPITIGPPPKPGTQATVIGFGLTGLKERTTLLRRVKVTLIDNETCKKDKSSSVIESFFELSPKDSFICSLDKPYKGACAGDSGGPIFLDAAKPILIGVISLGRHGCAEGVSIYSSAKFYNKWIQDSIKCLGKSAQENEQKNCVVN